MQIYIVSAVMYAALIYFITFHLPASPASRSLRLMMITACFWTVFTIMEISAADETVKMLAVRLQFTSISLLPVTIFLFGRSYIRRLVPRKSLALLLAVPAATNIIVWFFSIPNIFFQTSVLEAGRNTLSLSFGPWFFFIHTPYSYFLIIITIVMLISSFSHMQRIYRMQMFLLVGAFILPFLINIYYVIILPQIPQYNFTTAVFSISGVLLVWGLYKYEFMNLRPAARHFIIELIQDGVIVIDENRRIVDINPSAQTLCETAENLTGRYLKDIPLTKLREELESRLKDRHHMTIVEEGERVLDLRTYPMQHPSGEEFGTIITVRDISEQHALFMEVQELASMDSLTGLFNRRKLLEQLEQALQKSGSLALILFDIDNFKEINDTLGHRAGDIVLKSLADRCSSLKEDGIIGRLGGDEFALGLPGASAERAVELAERIRISIEQMSIPIPSGTVSTTVSIGVSQTRLLTDQLDIEELFASADRAMYRAKTSGRNRTASAGTA